MLLSIIVPSKGDAAWVARLVAAIPPSPDVEIIVAAAEPASAIADGVAGARHDVTWIVSAPGRGVQLNAGAARATGDWLWFVHADSRLPTGWLEAFRNLDVAQDALIIGGAFAFRLDSPAWQARVIERGVRWRVRLFDLPYGDQGIFVRRAVFEEMGGFTPLPLMEDVDFVRRLKRRGRLRHLTLAVTTSARRWEAEGWVRRSATNLVLLGLYGLGVSPQWLSRQYDSKKGPAPFSGGPPAL